MRAGLLRHRVQIQTLGGAQDAAGQQINTWTIYATVWAEILPVLGTERMNADQVQASITHRINMRVTHDAIPPTSRLVFTDNGVDRIFSIVSIIRPAERRIALQVLCQEQVAG